MSNGKLREVLISTSSLIQATHFYYGNSRRLKGVLKYYFKEKCYELLLYKNDGKLYSSKLYMDEKKTKEELYEQAKKDVKKYEEICSY